jgi:hypothetical protein
VRICDDGLWALSVSVQSGSGQPIKGISTQAFVDLECARQMLANPPPRAATCVDHSIYSVVQEPMVEGTLKVNIPTSETSHSSLLWTYRRFFQYRGLLVVVEYESGNLEGRAVEIPDLRQARHVTVDVP